MAISSKAQKIVDAAKAKRATEPKDEAPNVLKLRTKMMQSLIKEIEDTPEPAMPELCARMLAKCLEEVYIIGLNSRNAPRDLQAIHSVLDINEDDRQSAFQELQVQRKARRATATA